MINDFLKEKVFAVVGVSKNVQKYGYKVYKHLKGVGKKVYPVHPSVKEIEGERCYSSISDIPEKVDVVDIVVPPKVTENIVVECNDLGIKKVWIQPGAESQKAIDFCKANGIDVVHNTCIMMY